MGQKHIFEVIWDYSILTFIKNLKQASLKMSTACSSWRFLNIGVVCELYLALDMNLIAFFCNVLMRGPTLKPHAVIP